ncbi:MAG TPA: alpha-hydroxy-acid oxidizing enzyme [Chloroflexi bacterium]|jgi:4-hydroxymandelate oxidase|nr:alpha-hydroxy-acid oxidizing enzyme [Chloroflexota bacterium]HAL26276.1 alpha-hydroxy-acid oxidizing enzyme [Chloroflexota bacterium]
MTEPLNLDEFETIARETLPTMTYDFIAGGAEDERTVAGNRAAFARRVLRNRALVDVATRDLRTRLLGLDLPHPILLAPTALHRVAHPDGEAATARGAAAAGAVFTVSTATSMRLEEIAAAAPDALRWFQLYHLGQREASEDLIRQAIATGHRAIALTVDVPLLGRRERDLRNMFTLPEGVGMAHAYEPAWAPPSEERSRGWASPIASANLTWDDLKWIRAAAGDLPLLLKGIVRGDDAKRALELGVDAIWVSNHGGRQLDGAIATLDALADVVAAVGGRCPIVLDGGIRRGTDIIKALALGADAVAIGRPQMYGLAAGGADGVRRVVELLRAELDLAMALVGAPSLAALEPDLIG